MRLIGLAVVLTLIFGLAPLAVEAQQVARQVKIGVLCVGFCPFPLGLGPSQSLIIALERIGLVPGRTLVWDIGGITLSPDQIGIEAQKLVSRRPDLILVWPGNAAAARAAKDATRTIPIVLMAVPDVVEHGLVKSLGHPGGNITGTSVPLFDLTLKQLQILKEINPRLKRIILVQRDLDLGERKTVDRLRETAVSLGLDAAGISLIDPKDMEHALAAAQQGVTGILVIGSMLSRVHGRVQELALEHKLPLLMPWRAWEGSRPLLAYGPHIPTVAERTAALIDRILKGARPGDLPVEQPTRYELVIDGVMAKALGLTIPPAVKAQADEVLD